MFRLARLFAGSLYWKRGMLSHAFASAAIRLLAIHGSPFGCAGYDVKFYFYSVIVGKGARFRVLWLARLFAGSLYIWDVL